MEFIRGKEQRMVEKESMKPEPHGASGEKPLRIRRGRVDCVDLYEIKDSELDELERGSPADLYLNFSIALLSLAFSALTAICTVSTFRFPILETLFLVVAVVGFFGGLFLILLWWRSRKDVAVVVAQIRNRIPPESIGAPNAEAEQPSSGGEPPHDVEPNG